MSNLYTQAYEQSMNDPDGFWGAIAEDCHWYKKWDKVLDDSNKPFYRWFTGGETNTCYNAVDLHVENGLGTHKKQWESVDSAVDAISEKFGNNIVKKASLSKSNLKNRH